MVYTNRHVAHKSILHNTFKHSFGILKHIALHARNIHFARQFTRHERALMYGSPASGFISLVLSISLRRVARGLWVPRAASVTATNGICRNERRTARCTLGVRVGARHLDAEYTARNMAARKIKEGKLYSCSTSNTKWVDLSYPLGRR